MFEDGQTNVHDEGRSGRRPSVVSDDLLQSERRRFTISEPSCQFPQLSRTVLYEIITVRLGYHKFCVIWVPKMLTVAYKTQRIASALTFLESYNKDGGEFLNHVVRVMMKPGFHLCMPKPKNSQSSGCTRNHQTSRKSLNGCCLSES
jgi:hypothetical protein